MDDVEAARGEVPQSKGIEFAADTLDSGVCHMAHFKDPDGNVLMLHHRSAPGCDGSGNRQLRGGFSIT